MTTQLTRRSLAAAFAGAAAAPAAAIAATAPTTPMASLWAEAEALRGDLEAHRDAIAAATHEGGVPGWMRLGQEANRLGEARYARLVAILNAEPTSHADLAIMGRAALDDDIRYGGVTWAGEQLARATVALHGAA